MCAEDLHHTTPEQDDHVEFFHNIFKKEYVWPRDFESFWNAELNYIVHL